jgi:hypothetical protein
LGEITKRLHLGQTNFFLLPKSSGINSAGMLHSGQFCLGIIRSFIVSIIYGANGAAKRLAKGATADFASPSSAACSGKLPFDKNT